MPLRDWLLRGCYVLSKFDNVIWLIGDGRSGTTWAASLINHHGCYRELFEPFNPFLVKKAAFLIPHQYQAQASANNLLEEVAGEIFKGKYIERGVERENSLKRYSGLLIKDVSANLFAYWITKKYAQVNVVLILRHPFAVALSKAKKPNWLWGDDPMMLWNQPKLREDYLRPFEELIFNTVAKEDYILNQVLIWCIINYIPLKQFSTDKLHVLFYEELYKQPDEEIGKVERFVTLNTNLKVSIASEIIAKPSRVSGDQSNLLAGTSPLTSWKEEISPQQAQQGREIMAEFGLAELYDKDGIPNKSVVSAIMSKTKEKATVVG